MALEPFRLSPLRTPPRLPRIRCRPLLSPVGTDQVRHGAAAAAAAPPPFCVDRGLFRLSKPDRAPTRL